MRCAWILLLAGCANPPGPPAEFPPDSPLEALRKRSNAHSRFHWKAELTDGRQTVNVELGWKAPDHAFLRYGPTFAIYYAGGVGQYFTRGGYLRFDAKTELDRLRAAYAGVPIGGEPEPVFVLTHWEKLALNQGLRAVLSYGRLGSRLGWLPELVPWKAEGAVYRRSGLEIELDAEGFLVRVQAGERAGLVAKGLTLGDEVDDAIFQAPPREGLGDLSASAHQQLVQALEEDLHRWALATDVSDATLDALARAGIARRYDPEKMLTVLRDGLRQAADARKAENPGLGADLAKEKLELDRGKALSSVDVMEAEIQESAGRLLDRAFRGMPVTPTREHMREVAGRWKRAVSRQVDAQIRKPFERAVARPD